MTQVITRYFESAARARLVEKELLFARFPRRILKVFNDADGLGHALAKAHVEPETIEAYTWRMEDKGGAVILVEAGHKPLGVARITRETMAKMGAVDLGNITEEVYVKDTISPRSSIRADHPLFLTRDRDPLNTNYHMADWPIPLISRRNPNMDSLVRPHARMANWPIGLILRSNPRDEFAFPRHARMANLLLPLTIRRKPSDNFAFPRHARMANWPMALTNRRKPYTGSWIGRHPRMANWPFPHLINGKTGTNSLVPGGPRMANLILPLTSDRKPVDKFAFPRHARMANLPLPLLSQRKPITTSMIPKHARMADLFLPLVLRQSGSSQRRSGTLLSRWLRLPTLSRR